MVFRDRNRWRKFRGRNGGEVAGFVARHDVARSIERIGDGRNQRFLRREGSGSQAKRTMKAVAGADGHPGVPDRTVTRRLEIVCDAGAGSRFVERRLSC